jgi:hypothetical protein
VYCNQGPEVAGALLKSKYPEMTEQELEHRLTRYGLNPCGEITGSDFHCVSGSTKIIHEEGIDSIDSLVGREVKIWNGKKWSKVIPFQTGSQKQLYRVEFSDGTYLDTTEKHRWFVANRFEKTYRELTTLQLAAALQTEKYKLHTEPFKINYTSGQKTANAYTLGVLVGDGTTCNKDKHAVLRLHGEKRNLPVVCNSITESVTENHLTTFCTGFEWEGYYVKALKQSSEALLTIGKWDCDSILSFIAGLADTDGSQTESGGIRIYISKKERAEAIYLLLLKCGIRSSISLMSLKGTQTNKGIRSEDVFYVTITDCKALPCHRLNTKKGHACKAKGKNQIIKSIKPIDGLHPTYCFTEKDHHKGVFNGTLTGQCNLSEVHLNNVHPFDYEQQQKVFEAGAIAVATLLNHSFVVPRYALSRSLDPIVGVSFTGLFDFFVHAFGTPWLKWWEAGRPDTEEGLAFKQQEAEYLSRWKEIVHTTVWNYCNRHGLRRPNRCTTVQPAGTKSLLTNASPGWHPPKAQRFIRRITFRRDDPVALACMEYGYTVVPSQSDKDEEGRLLDNPFDPRCTEWLVEIPTEVSWANIPGADEVEISKFSALAQFDFYMQVQKYYTAHNTSATIEYRENEIEDLSEAIYDAIQNNKGYISAALLARFDANETFPRLPFEPISKEKYDELQAGVKERQITADFFEALLRYDNGELIEAGPAGCDGDKCLLPLAKPE